MKKFSTNNVLLAGIAVVVFTIVTVLVISIQQSRRIRSTVGLVDHTQEVLRCIQNIITASLENETGARGYVITAQDSFLAPLRRAHLHFRTQLDTLEQLVSDNPEQGQWIKPLEKQIQQRVAFSDSMVNVRRTRGLEAAAEMVKSGTGKKMTDEILLILQKMRKTEEALLAKRKDDSDDSIFRLNGIMYAALGAALLLGYIITGRVRNDIRRQRESQEMFLSLLDAAPDATVIFNEDGKVMRANRTAEILFGYSPADFAKMQFNDLIPLGSENVFLFEHTNIFRAAEQYTGRPLELEVVTEGMKIIATEVAISPIHTRKGKLVAISFRNITERKRAIEQLNYMARLMEETSEAVYATDPDFIIRNWNKAAERLYGYTAAEAIGKPVAVVVRPQIADETRDEIRRQMREIGFWKGEVSHLHKDGSPVILLISNTAIRNSRGTIDGFVHVVRDISDRKKVEDAVRELNVTLEKRVEQQTNEILATEQQLRYTLDNMMEGAQIIGFDWRYLYVNDAMTRHGKYSKEELLGHTVMEKYPGIEKTEIFKVYQKCFTERVSIHLENEFVFPDQTSGWFELSFQPVPEGIFILSMDITDRKRAEQNIMQINEILEQKVSDRTQELQVANKELESFTYSVSHDLRAPLRIIDGYADILYTDYADKVSDDGKRVLGIIKSNARRMGQLIDDLLNLSQVGRKELVMHQTDMQRLASSVVDEQLQFAGSSADIRMSKLLPAYCDSSLVRQVWVNLISNAIKYSGKNPAPVIHIRSEANDDYVVYTVEDNGVGFDMKYQDKLFGVFQRLHKPAEFEGTGIGLALVNRIILKHHGRVWASAQPGKGARFSFSLPSNQHKNQEQ